MSEIVPDFEDGVPEVDDAEPADADVDHTDHAMTVEEFLALTPVRVSPRRLVEEDE